MLTQDAHYSDKADNRGSCDIDELDVSLSGRGVIHLFDS